MKIKVTDKILQYDGEPVLDVDKKPMTWRKMIFYVLNLPYPDKDGRQKHEFTPEQKERAFVITSKVYSAEEVNITTEEASFILEQIKKKESPLIVGRAKGLFDGKEK